MIEVIRDKRVRLGGRNWKQLPIAVASLLALNVAAASCRQSKPSSEAIEDVQSALSSNAGDILGFEVPADWHITSGQNIALTSSTTHTQGNLSLAVRAQNYVSIQSALFSVNTAIAGPISYDLFLPPPANPFWAGATQAYVDCHSLSIYNQFLGQTELTGVPTGKFTTISFALPSATKAALSHGCQDLSFTIVINVPSNSTGTYLLDNLQLDGPPVLTACTATPNGSGGNGGGATQSVTFSSQLVRPDVGTFVMNWTNSSTSPNPVSDSIAITLNGNPLLQIVSSTTGAGASHLTDTYFPPYAGVQVASATSDGQTVVATIDGRRTVPAPVGSDPSQIRFVDGGPAPQLTVPPAVSDAVAALFAGAAANSAACLSQLGIAGTPVSGAPMAAAAAAAADPPGHHSDTQTTGCLICQGTCVGEEFICDIGVVKAAAAAAAACGPFAIVCGVVVGVVTFGVCELIQYKCQVSCDSQPNACCPVACGGEGHVTPPIGGCCLATETCLNSSQGLCCSTGTTPCGGNSCCGPGTTCAPTGPSSAACCTPSQINPAGQCCPGGIGAQGQCCLLGSCRTVNDCSPSLLGLCTDGCCTLG